jgi:hypothetical protein
MPSSLIIGCLPGRRATHMDGMGTVNGLEVMDQISSGWLDHQSCARHARAHAHAHAHTQRTCHHHYPGFGLLWDRANLGSWDQVLAQGSVLGSANSDPGLVVLPSSRFARARGWRAPPRFHRAYARAWRARHYTHAYLRTRTVVNG